MCGGGQRSGHFLPPPQYASGAPWGRINGLPANPEEKDGPTPLKERRLSALPSASHVCEIAPGGGQHARAGGGTNDADGHRHVQHAQDGLRRNRKARGPSGESVRGWAVENTVCGCTRPASAQACASPPAVSSMLGVTWPAAPATCGEQLRMCRHVASPTSLLASCFGMERWGLWATTSRPVSRFQTLCHWSRRRRRPPCLFPRCHRRCMFVLVADFLSCFLSREASSSLTLLKPRRCNSTKRLASLLLAGGMSWRIGSS